MKTVLYEQHNALGARMVDFCGWEMPIYYDGIISEHLNVRNNVGIFDVSHMGRVLVQGKDAESYLDYLSTNKIAGKSAGTATYTVWCDIEGGSVDDVIVYKEEDNRFFVIVNAGNRQKDFEHMVYEAENFDVDLQSRFHDDGILAVQGPQANDLGAHIFPQTKDLKPMHFQSLPFGGEEIAFSRTGYTGAGGFEIYASNKVIVELWHQFLEEGKKYRIAPVGLGARNTLRLEMGYALYGHEISDTIAPIESVSAWTVKWDKDDFLGKSALLKLKMNRGKRAEYGVVLAAKGVIREGYTVFKGGNCIGKVTSGTHSPTLNCSIGIILVSEGLKDGDEVEVKVRDHMCRAVVTPLPFLKSGAKH